MSKLITDNDGTIQVKFYRLIELGEKENADALVQAVWTKLDEDGLLEIMRTRLQGVVTDSGTFQLYQCGSISNMYWFLIHLFTFQPPLWLDKERIMVALL